MYKCISLWLIVLTIIMTFCVSHQRQLDRDPKGEVSVANKVVTNNDVKDDAMKNHENGSVKGTESTSLGEHEKHFMDDIELSRKDPWRQFYVVCVRI